jgi:hypothetical protein
LEKARRAPEHYCLGLGDEDVVDGHFEETSRAFLENNMQGGEDSGASCRYLLRAR